MLVLIACTTMPDKPAPPTEVMPYPFYLALKGNQLLVNAVNSDDRYSNGRLVSISTDALQQSLNGPGNKTPINFSSVVSSNRLIPSGVGPLMVSQDQLVFYEAKNVSYSLPFPDSKLACDNPSSSITACSSARSIYLSHENPNSIALLDNNFTLISYGLKEIVDIVSLKESKIIKSLHLESWLKNKGIKIPKDEKIIVKKIAVPNPNPNNMVYFVLERRAESQIYNHAVFGAYLLRVSIKDILEKDITDSDVTLWNLKSDLSILSMHDFVIDETQKIAYILAQSPETLFKLDLSKNALIETAVMPSEPTMLAASFKENRVVIPSFNENRIIMMTLSPLRILKVSEFHGQGPAYAVIDEVKKLIYVSYFNEGTVAIFDLQLKFLGSLFEPASVRGGT